MARDRRLFSANLAARLASRAGKRYRPSNGDEGERFQARWCADCRRDDFDDETGEGGCEILVRAFAFDVGDAEYPGEWQYGDDGQPVCTAFDDVNGPPRGERVEPMAGQGRLFEG